MVTILNLAIYKGLNYSRIEHALRVSRGLVAGDGKSNRTDALYGEQCATISAVEPILTHIATILEESENDTQKEIKEQICKYRYMDEDINQLLEFASFLDA